MLAQHIANALQSSDDVRLGELIVDASLEKNGWDVLVEKYASEKVDIAIIGFPFDEGVRRNGGRVGAKDAPASFRKMIKRAGTVVNPEHGIDCRNLKILDLGNVQVDDEANLEKAHELLEECVYNALNRLGAATVFVVGGGNDQSYPNAKGLLRHVEKFDRVGVINLDAHLDVRDLKNGQHHSGSPFRRLLQTEGFNGSHFVEYAAQGTQCSQKHVDFINEKGANIYWLQKDVERVGAVPLFNQILTKDFANTDKIFVSFDLDCVSMAWAGGVSCPSPLGLTAQNALEICFNAGHNSKVQLFDLSEYNPKIEEYNTGKLVAAMFVHFCLGYASRN